MTRARSHQYYDKLNIMASTAVSLGLRILVLFTTCPPAAIATITLIALQLPY